MAKNDPLGFDFGYNVKPKRAKPAAGAKKGKRKLTAAQKYTAAMYTQSRRRR
jgi:hypothetical protein